MRVRLLTEPLERIEAMLALRDYEHAGPVDRLTVASDVMDGLLKRVGWTRDGLVGEVRLFGISLDEDPAFRPTTIALQATARR